MLINNMSADNDSLDTMLKLAVHSPASHSSITAMNFYTPTHFLTANVRLDWAKMALHLSLLFLGWAQLCRRL